MIFKIDIHNAATFGNAIQSLDDLKKINYFFGANGTGKTTISRIIADPSQFHDCTINWIDNFPLETYVYNHDFIDRNFTTQNILKGVFTLGEKQADILNKIETIKTEADKLMEEINSLTSTLQGQDGRGGKIAELANLENVYKEKFFSLKQKHDDKLSGGFEGVRNSKEKFKEKVLAESESNNTVLLSISELEQKAIKIFSGTLLPAQSIAIPQIEQILSHEKKPILKKRVIGKEDVDIAAIIKKLDNSDWVRQGISYYETNNKICPFCHQMTDEKFAKTLSEYFDESFEQDSMAINAIVSDYLIDGSRIQQEVKSIIDSASDFIDNEKLKMEKQILDSILAANNQKLTHKKKESSQVVELDSLNNVLTEIVNLISNANTKIDKHNKMVNNIATEKKSLTAQIWRFVIEELRNDILDYNQQKTNINNAILNIKKQIEKKTSEKQRKAQDLRELEKQTISIQPTLDGINSLLVSFGFKNFSLAKGDDGKTYKLIRPNGIDAQKTLSDGEKNFVAFLYFYHLLRGSQFETGVTSNKIVVFDDPVSSLDSDVLFIVSSLVRELFNDIRKNKGTIKQIFILTHNIYFHKEVTYNSKRNKDKLNEEAFWLIKKQNNDSIIIRQTTNPIKTSYELLWDEVRSKHRNNATIQNILRRILENYFKLLGGIPLDNLYMEFAGDDKIKCKALCSWVNDGSHSVFDDGYYTPLDDTNVEKYLNVFKMIFEKCKQIAHYNMMMGIENQQTPSESQQEPPNDQTPL